MTFDLSNNYDVNKAQTKFAALIASGKKIELKENQTETITITK
jgi:hypothetical protein